MSSISSTIKKADKIIVGAMKSVSYISGVCLIGIMLVAFFNVVGEKLRMLGLPVSGIPASTEIIQYLHIPVVFLASAYVTLDRGHTRIDLVSSRFPEKVKKAFDIIGNLAGALICSFISQRGFVQMVKFITRHKMSSVSGKGFPLWPFALILAVGFGLLAISFLWSIIMQLVDTESKEGGDDEWKLG